MWHHEHKGELWLLPSANPGHSGHLFDPQSHTALHTHHTNNRAGITQLRYMTDSDKVTF